MKKNLLMYFALASSLVLVSGCDNPNQPSSEQDVVVEGIRISSANNIRSIKVDETLQLTAVVYPESASQNVTWSSSNPDLATVDANGFVNAKAVGNVNIIATSNSNSEISQSFALIIEAKDVAVILPTDIELTSENNITAMKTGEKLQLNAKVIPADASQSVVWESSDPSIATVSRGVVSALKEGSVTITVRHKDDNTISETITLTITKNDDVGGNNDYTSLPYMSHETFMALEKGAEDKVKVKGYVTYITPEKDSKVSYYIQNGVEGFYVYAQDITAYPVEVGKSYELVGSKKYYNGMHEIVDVEYFNELSDQLTYTINDINDKDPSSLDAMNMYHNSYVKATATITDTVNVGEKAYNVNVNINNHNTVLRVDPANMVADEFSEISSSFASTVIGSKVEFNGIMTAFGYGKASPQIQIIKSDDLKFSTVSPMDIVSSAKTSLSIRSTLQVSDTTIALPTSLEEYKDVEISWSSNHECINAKTGKVNHFDEDVDVKLTATIKHKTDTQAIVTKDFIVSVYGTTFNHDVVVSLDVDDASTENMSYGNSETKPSYKEGNVTLGNPAKTWMLRNALISSTNSDHREGAFSIRAQSNKDHAQTGRIEILEAGEYNYVEFLAATYGSDDAISLGVEYTLDDGKTWLDSGKIVNVDLNQLQLYRFKLPEGNKRIAIYVVENTGKRVNIDNIKLYK